MDTGDVVGIVMLCRYFLIYHIGYLVQDCNIFKTLAMEIL